MFSHDIHDFSVSFQRVHDVSFVIDFNVRFRRCLKFEANLSAQEALCLMPVLYKTLYIGKERNKTREKRNFTSLKLRQNPPDSL